MAKRIRRVGPLPYLAGGVVIYLIVAVLSRFSVHQHTWLGVESIAGSFALMTVIETTGAFVGLRVRLGMLGRGVAQFVIGVPALVIPLSDVPVGGYQGWASFWAYSVVFGGLYVTVRSLALIVYGWQGRPAALKRLQEEVAAAHHKAAREQAASGGAPPVGHYELTLATGPYRFLLAAFMGLLGLAGLGLLVLSVLIIAASTPGNPAPVSQYVLLSAAGVAMCLLCGPTAVGLVRMRGWLEGTTLNVIHRTGRKSTDLAMVHRAVFSTGNGQSPPMLRLSGSGGHLQRLPLRQWGTRRLLPPGDLIRIADALAAGPLHGHLTDAIGALRQVAAFSTGHLKATAGR